MLTKAHLKQHIKKAIALLLENHEYDLCRGIEVNCGECAYSSVAAFRVYKTLGLDAQLVAAFGDRKVKGERAPVRALIHAVIYFPQWKLQADMYEDYVDEDILEEWCEEWEHEHNDSIVERPRVVTYTDEKAFWKECRRRGSPKDEALIVSYMNKLWEEWLKYDDDPIVPLIKALLEQP